MTHKEIDKAKAIVREALGPHVGVAARITLDALCEAAKAAQPTGEKAGDQQ